MKIESITLTQEEVNIAIQTWLLTKFGLTLKVRKATKEYTYSTDYLISIEDPTPLVEAAPPSLPPGLTDGIINELTEKGVK